MRPRATVRFLCAGHKSACATYRFTPPCPVNFTNLSMYYHNSYHPASSEHSAIVKLGWYSSHHFRRSFVSASVHHFNDRGYVCSVDRPRQNGQSRCRADDDVWVTIGTGRCLLWLLWRSYKKVRPMPLHRKRRTDPTVSLCD